MMSLTEGLRLKIASDFTVLGAGAFQVQKWPAINLGDVDWRKYMARKDLTREQAEALRGLPHVKHVSYEEFSWRPERLATSERQTKRNVLVTGVVPEYELTSAVQVAAGRFVVRRRGDARAARRLHRRGRLTATLRRIRGVAPQDESDFEIFSNESLSEMLDDLATIVAAATFGVCALALLVGGIGLMNIMLVSVTERTREIGVRMAVGARRRRIVAQFLAESVALSAIGGALGVLAGAALAVGAREIFRVPASIPAWAVILSLATSGGAGLLFGIYPAARASKLDPVEAMRTE